MTAAHLPFRSSRPPSPLSYRILAAALALAGGIGLPSTALAQPAGTDKDDFLYNVQANDTLGELASRFLRNASRWSAVASLNGVTDQYRLPIGKQLRIPLAWIPRQAASAELTYTLGPVLVDGQPARTGSPLSTGNRLVTGNGGAAAVSLPDGGHISVPANSQLSFEVLQEFAGTGLLDSVLALESGDMETEVAPDHKGVGRFEVRTPVTVTGVRGTRFRVRTDGQGTINEVLDGQVQLASGPSIQDATNRQRITAGHGSRVGADGHAYPVAPLPPTPAILGSKQDGGKWVVDFEPVAGAASYLVQLSQDAAGTQIIKREPLSGPPLIVSLPQKHYYASIIAVDAQGLRGAATLGVALTGFANILTSADGSPILAGSGDEVLIQAFD